MSENVVAPGTDGADARTRDTADEPSPPVTESDAATPESGERRGPSDLGAMTTERRAAEAEPIDDALSTVQEIRSCIPAWMRALNDAITEAGKATPDVNTLKILLQCGEEVPPTVACAKLAHPQILGSHAEFMSGALEDAARWWRAAVDQVAGTPEYRTVSALLERAVVALGLALQHALYLTFLDDARRAPVGHPSDVATYCKNWGSGDAQIDELWLWLNQDPLRFGGEPLPLALDTANRVVYHTAENWYVRWACAAAPLWGGALSFGLVALLFFVLNKAGLTTWPHAWGWKMLVLFVFVVIGAILHLGARAVNINYDNPIRVYDAGGIVRWLSLRWLGVLQMYIPVTFVVAGLWGAKNIPTSFRALGTAILAGYSADSAFRAAFSSLQGQASAKQSETPKTAAGAGASSNVKPAAR